MSRPRCQDYDWVKLDITVCNAQANPICCCYDHVTISGTIRAAVPPGYPLISNPCCQLQDCIQLLDITKVLRYLKFEVEGIWPNSQCYTYPRPCLWEDFPSDSYKEKLVDVQLPDRSQIPIPPMIIPWEIGPIPVPRVSGALLSLRVALENRGDTSTSSTCCATITQLGLGTELVPGSPEPPELGRCREPWVHEGPNAIYPPGLKYPSRYTHITYGPIPGDPTTWGIGRPDTPSSYGSLGSDSWHIQLRVVHRGPPIGTPDQGGRLGGIACPCPRRDQDPSRSKNSPPTLFGKNRDSSKRTPISRNTGQSGEPPIRVTDGNDTDIVITKPPKGGGDAMCCAVWVGDGGHGEGGVDQRIGCCHGLSTVPCTNLPPYILHEGEVYTAQAFCRDIINGEHEGCGGKQPYNYMYTHNASTCEQFFLRGHVCRECYDEDDQPPTHFDIIIEPAINFWRCIDADEDCPPHGVLIPCEDCTDVIT
jgi:hypothetical protein